MMNKIPYTSYQGSAKDLSQKGDAVEFIQPWYTPISTTPENTGMAIGGIGNTFTLTPNGDTPNFSFIPGIFIDCSDDDIHFNDFYASVMEPLSLDCLEIKCMSDLQSCLNYYPAVFNGEEIDFTSGLNVLDEIKSSLVSRRFYSENKESFTRWNIEFSSRTQLFIDADPGSFNTQIHVALDFFNGLLTNNTAKSLSLTANRGGDIESIKGEHVQYQALYPMAEYHYDGFGDVKISRKVVSPLVKEDKKLCSLPLHWNHFELKNRSDKPKLVTLVQPLANLIGSTYRKGRDGVQDSACTLTQNAIAQRHESIRFEHQERAFSGVSLESDSPYQSDVEGQVIFGVQADSAMVKSGKVCISSKPSIYQTNVQDQVAKALNSGRVNSEFDRGIYSGREPLSAIVTVQVELAPGETVDLRFAQVMDHSKILLNGWESKKAYTQFFPEEKKANAILDECLPQLVSIEQRIIEQQQRFIEEAGKKITDADTTLRYATMAMNTLSFLSESTVWDCQDKFLVKECVDYPFFNSLDVYFYGSFSLLYLLPELDGCVMKEFANAILAEDDAVRRYWEYEDKPNAELCDQKYQGTRAIRGAVIHDLGSPYDIQPDAYSWHNVKEWKDLAPKYILMVFRHYQHSKDRSVVESCWTAVKESIDFLSGLIEEGDTLPLTRGTDDTFDNLSSHGISIYCASLWAAGLKAGHELALLMEENELAADYLSRSEQALETVEQSLWDEKAGYYHFYVTPVQAKHLTGKGYENLQTLGLTLSGNAIDDKNLLNDYLNETDLSSSQGKVEQRGIKKQQLLEIAPAAFTESYQSLVLDSDNSFGDSLLADSYLKLVGLDGLFPQDRIERTLDFTYQQNFLNNSPKLGVANMTLADGAPHEAFQAQDVWIGVQFSVATALNLAGKHEQAQTLMDTVYTALYQYAKIPFAAPEGFNCSVSVDADALASEFSVESSLTTEWLKVLKQSECLLSDGRVSPDMTTDRNEFSGLVSGVIDQTMQEGVQKYLLSTGLKYTAGRYFRPGMIFAYLFK
ncbi:GH116 family glycosyl hydrolase [Vibrio sp. 10N.261.55.A7]|uniref:GH116 family glycosyl hydrolase n=1 Tax=Vibrio sp. 10N.261.55.A7 TaxID=1880851 RepID=UPI000C866A58|nr:GH116 family glycosyl hydrolase [Vibrio sp. 10N.261.55.A7]PMJ98727.1 glucosylceramidase [Vibrio sp. 10N.261.55.A7]